MAQDIRPTEQWPLLLLGPMLRRVTRERVHVFIATSKELTNARLSVYSGRVHADSDHPDGIRAAPVATSGATTLRQVGKRLFVGMLIADLPANVADPEGGLFSYDLRLTIGAAPYSLKDLGLLGGSEDGAGDEALDYYNKLLFEAPLGYKPGYLPNFRLPPTNVAALRVVHGSCRKPHGGEGQEPDALAIADAIIRASLDPASSDLPPSNRERPHQLILTGDQIYADDVASGLLQALGQAGEDLLGWTEKVPFI